MIYLHENGVTVVAKSGAKGAKGGEIYELNGEKYYVAKDQYDLKVIINKYGNSYGQNRINSKGHSFPLNRIVTSKVTTFNSLFAYMEDFNEDVSNWDTSRVKSMSDMFAGCKKFNQPIGNWNTKTVTAMLNMFYGATSFNQPIGDWDTSRVDNISNMFESAESFNQNINNWDVSNVFNMLATFKDATSFNQPLDKWKINGWARMFSLFENAKSFNQNLSTWTVSGSLTSLFKGCESFNSPLNWDCSKVYSMKSLFEGATSFNQDISGWNISSLSDAQNMFYGASSFNAPIGKWNVKSFTNMQNMFREAKAFNQDISTWDVSNVTKMTGLFQDASSFNQNIRNWKLNEKLKKSRTMFQGATAFNIDEYNPFLNENINKEIATRRRNIDTSTANLSPEDKRTFSKIKKLIVARDIDQINMGVELILSLNNNNIYNTLLDGCKLTQVESRYGPSEYHPRDMESKLITNKLFTGNGNAQPYLNYALMTIAANIPDNNDIQIDESLKIKNITELNLSEISFWISPELNNFKFLEKLKIGEGLQENTQIDSLKELKCSGAVGSLKWLSGLNQLEKLSMDFSSYGDDITDIDSFKNLVSLRELELQSWSASICPLTDINFLSECKKLEKLKFSISGNYSSEVDITDISVLPKLTNLESLEILKIKDQDISPIGSCKKLKNLSLDLSSEYEDWDFSKLNSCKELNYLNIKGGGLYQINAQIENINGIKLPKNLNSIKLGNSLAFSGIDGMNLLNKNTKSNNNNEFKRASVTDIIDKGIVSYYQGKPFTGIMFYHYKYDSNWNREDDSQPVVSEYEMVDGLKHGSFKQYYIGGKLTGKLKLEHNFVNDQHDKIIGFYDGYGNNYVENDLCVGANSLVFKRKNKIPHIDTMGNPIETDAVFTNVKSYGKGYPPSGSLGYNSDQDNPEGLKDALFYYNNKLFSGQVLFHKYVSNWNLSKEKHFDKSLYAYLDSSIKDHIPGLAPDDDYISFLITIKHGRLTGKFCASLNDKFFSGTTNEEGTQSPLSTIEVNDSSIQNSNELSLDDKSIVITGVFENYSRNELKDMIKENGGNPSSSVTSNTFLILAGSKMGPKKKVLAEKLGVKIIDVDSFIKEYINKNDNENLEAKTNFINMFYPDLADKKTVSKKKLKSEDKKTFTKIKSLLQSRDFDKIDMGIELMRSINIVEFYEALLADCKISSGEDQKIIANKLFTGSGPAQPYLNYALYLLIYYCPDEAEVDKTLRKDNINFLNTNILFPSSYQHKYRLPLIENYTFLKELNINLNAFDIKHTKPENILKNSYVEKIKVLEPNGPLLWLKNFPQIKSLFIGSKGYSSSSNKATNHDAFHSLINLEELEISCPSEKNIDFLKNCVRLKKLTLNLGGGYGTTPITENIDALKYLKKLEELEINGGSGRRADLVDNFSFSGLSGCKNLKTLKLNLTASDEALTNLKNCSNLDSIDFSSISNCKIKLNMLSLKGISKLDKLKNISLNGVSLLESNSKLFIN